MITTDCAANDILELITNAIATMPGYSDQIKAEEINNCSEDAIEESIREGLCISVVSNGETIGACYGEKDAGIIWLSWIAVVPERQHEGYGRQLLHSFLDAARLQGHKVWCSVLTGNDASNVLFEKLGFEKVTTLYNHWHGLDFNIWQISFT